MKQYNSEFPLFQRILQSWNECIKLFLDTAIKEKALQVPSVLMALFLQTGFNSILRDRHISLFTEMSRTVLRVSQPFI
jgi:hypothetical protein